MRPSVFSRYHIVADGDLERALGAEAAYVAEQEAAGGKVAVLNQNTDTTRTLTTHVSEAIGG